MKAFLLGNRYLLVALIVLSIWFAWFRAWSQSVTASPLDEPISFAVRGKIEKEIYVPIPEHYQLCLVFERSDVPFQQLEQLLGKWVFENGRQIPSGIAVPIRWSILKGGSQVTILHGERRTYGAYAWSRSEVYRLIEDVKLKPGHYIFRAEVLREVPELAHLKVRLTLKLDMKSASTWQLLYVWIGSIASFYGVVPLMVMLMLIIATRAVRASVAWISRRAA